MEQLLLRELWVNNMKQVILILAIFASAIAGSAVAAVADNPLNLSAGSIGERNVHPRILVLKNGDILAVWESGHDKSDNDIVCRIWKRDINGWDPPVGTPPHIAALKIRNAQFPQLVEDRDGVVHMSFMDGDASYDRDVYYCYYQQGEWSPPQNVCPTAVNSAWPRICLDRRENSLYITWQHVWNNRFDGKDIVYVKMKQGIDSWSVMKRFSHTPASQSIHQATVCTGGRMYGVWMDGDSERDVWGLRAGWADDATGNWQETELVPPAALHQPQWPDLEIDSSGNILGIFSRRDAPLEYVLKPSALNHWQSGFLADGGGITFFGITVARNDVAYCMYRRNTGVGFLPVLIRFDGNKASKPEPIDHPSLQPAQWIGHMDIAVSIDGSIHSVWSSGHPSHVPTQIMYIRQSRHLEAPDVSIEVIRNVGRRVELHGGVLSNDSKLTHQNWYIPELDMWTKGDRLIVEFPQIGVYTAYYLVADQNNIYGYAQKEIHLRDIPIVSENLPNRLLLRKD